EWRKPAPTGREQPDTRLKQSRPRPGPRRRLAMSVVSIFFPRTNARDLHLLPGLVSPRPDHLLFIEDTTGNKRPDTPPAGVKVSFQALFIGAPSDHGVTIDEATGEIKIASPLPAGTRLRSFIVLCGCNEGTNIFSLPIRVHVHESIEDMWVTPNLVLH